jgi:hypothetical protein
LLAVFAYRLRWRGTWRGYALGSDAMTNPSFEHHREAALALLNQCPKLSHKEAGFLGHVCVADALSDKQHDWLAKLLERHTLPPLAAGGAQ